MTKKLATHLPIITIPPRGLGIADAAQYAGCTVWALRELYWAKKIKAGVIGRRLIFPVEELDRLLDGLKAGA
jgi:hypothetical protein